MKSSLFHHDAIGAFLSIGTKSLITNDNFKVHFYPVEGSLNDHITHN